MRKVLFSKESHHVPTVNGKFHQWGSVSEGFAGEKRVVTIGIIEDNDGNVHVVYPWQIKFVEEWES